MEKISLHLWLLLLSEEANQVSEHSQHRPIESTRSSDSVSSGATNDDVFDLGSSAHSMERHSTSGRSHTNSPEASRVTNHTPSKARPTYNSNSMPLKKAFNPFPKPATGLLSAEKAKVGVKFGLYKPEDALSYVKPSERRNFLNDENNYIGRMAMASQSTMW